MLFFATSIFWLLCEEQDTTALTFMKIPQITSQKKMCLYSDLNSDTTTHTVEHKALPDEYKKQCIYSKLALFDPLN